jgi:hypothetical protein
MTSPTIDAATRALEQEAERVQFEHLRPYEQVAVLLMTANPYTSQPYHSLDYISRYVVKAGATWALSAHGEKKKNYGKHPEYGQRLMAYARDLERSKRGEVATSFREAIDNVLAWRRDGDDAIVVRSKARYQQTLKVERKNFPKGRPNQTDEDISMPTQTVAAAPEKSQYAPEPEPEEISIPVSAEPARVASTVSQDVLPDISSLNGRLSLVQMAHRVEKIMSFAQQQQDALGSIVDELQDVAENSPPMFQEILSKVAADFRQMRDLYNTAVTTYLRSL